MISSGTIGILGGVGPYAGLDLVKKIFDNTRASRDQDHLPVMLFSFPEHIADRIDFLVHHKGENPGIAIGNILIHMARSGATVLGIPCNTIHSDAILHPALDLLYQSGLMECSQKPLCFVHMIDEVILSIRETMPYLRTVGVLCTQGTYSSHVYANALSAANLTPLFPDEAGRESVQQAISHPQYGIKACSNPVTLTARHALEIQAEQLIARGAQALILGCTEIPLALQGTTFHSVPLIDATNILARALIRTYAPDKLL